VRASLLSYRPPYHSLLLDVLKFLIHFLIFSEDVLRARLRTIGAQEYRFFLETGPGTGREWRIYDVVGIPLPLCTVP
jgi:hypothetical protein